MQKRSGTPKGLTYYRKGGAASKKSKGSKICPEGKSFLGKRTFDTYPSAYGGLPHQSIAKTLTMPKSPRVAKERVGNG